MQFNSLSFLVFFAIVFAVDRALRSWRSRRTLLLLASYLFYAAWNPPFVLLLWLSTLVDWVASRHLARATETWKRRALLLISLVVNLGLLSFFKYGDLLLEAFQEAAGLAGVTYEAQSMGLVLPVGISFYTFQSMSYTIDVYRGRIQPSTSLGDFALYVTFFPQLVAGPIVRAGEFLPQCADGPRATGNEIGWGLTLLVIGLFQKVFLADAIFAPVADRVFDSDIGTRVFDGRHVMGAVEGWLGTLSFSGQIYCDFAGYSTCAIGVALCLGFGLPDNFRSPYAAIGFSDFWRRWHISLSTWLRDYLYIELGGNRRGLRRRLANVMVTMLLGGLWHGAGFQFFAWGGLHGLFLWAEQLGKRFVRVPVLSHPVAQVLLGLLTYYCVCISWVPFRARDLPTAADMLWVMHGGGKDAYSQFATADLLALVAVVLLVASHWLWRSRDLEDTWRQSPWWARSLALVVMLSCIVGSPQEDRAFVYFQF